MFRTLGVGELAVRWGGVVAEVVGVVLGPALFLPLPPFFRSRLPSPHTSRMMPITTAAMIRPRLLEPLSTGGGGGATGPRGGTAVGAGTAARPGAPGLIGARPA